MVGTNSLEGWPSRRAVFGPTDDDHSLLSEDVKVLEDQSSTLEKSELVFLRQEFHQVLHGFLAVEEAIDLETDAIDLITFFVSKFEGFGQGLAEGSITKVDGDEHHIPSIVFLHVLVGDGNGRELGLQRFKAGGGWWFGGSEQR